MHRAGEVSGRQSTDGLKHLGYDKYTEVTTVGEKRDVTQTHTDRRVDSETHRGTG